MEDDLQRFVSDGSRMRRLLRLGYLLTGNEADSADLVQEALVRVWARPGHASDIENLEAFLGKTMTRLQLNRARRERRWREVRGLLLLGRQESPEDQVALDDLVVRALGSLTPLQRAAFSLQLFDDLPVKQIAAVLGCSVGGVKRHLADARKRLATELQVGEKVSKG
ncbi:MAG: sigma-70 family RNA polymerase sigma factor [Kineosporiaceae bacterium]|nr:sigma-70 family RNA polymerase sigma factor [Kineosporiaceae bacterium]